MVSRFMSTTFTSNGTFTVPAGVTRIFLTGCGGGGGGGSGNVGSSSTTQIYGSGGGGAGAQLYSIWVDVTPGTAYTVTIGGGGAGGSTSSSPGNGITGNDGSSTTFDSLATFIGGMGGQGDVDGVNTAPGRLYVPGGMGVANSHFTGTIVDIFTSGGQGPVYTIGPGYGGSGVTYNSGGVKFPQAGNYSIQGFAGGAAGTIGSASGSYPGGGAGGGGGGGPFGVGGAGGNGSNGNSGGSTSNATAGASAAANTGAGGGGGGGSGNNSSGTAGSAGAGGNGGSGKLIVTWIE